jgi:ubiquinone/menaquinone biosynthesis C-methylase UbiE
VVGVDRSPEMVAEALRRSAGSGLPIEFVEGDARALDFPDASFDRSRAERVLIHLRDPAVAVRDFWAELDQGEREGWLCSGVICFNVVGHKPS